MRLSWQTPNSSRNYDKVLASTWIRCLQLRAPLSRRGVKSSLNSVHNLDDVVVFQRRQDRSAHALARKARANGKKIVFDLSVNYISGEKMTGRTYGVTKVQRDDCLRMIESSDVITCSSSELKSLASKYHPNVHYLPDSIDLTHFSVAEIPSSKADKDLRVVWNGVSPKIVELSEILPVLSKRGVGLIAISDNPKVIHQTLAGAKVSYEFRRWAYKSFPQNLREGQIAISVKNALSPYENANSSFKILAPMAVGVPALASPIPAYREALATGGGALCGSPEEFDAFLGRFLDDPQTRQLAGKKARLAAESFSLDSVADQLLRILLDLM